MMASSGLDLPCAGFTDATTGKTYADAMCVMFRPSAAGRAG
jgi:hypothetical protein